MTATKTTLRLLEGTEAMITEFRALSSLMESLSESLTRRDATVKAAAIGKAATLKTCTGAHNAVRASIEKRQPSPPAGAEKILATPELLFDVRSRYLRYKDAKARAEQESGKPWYKWTKANKAELYRSCFESPEIQRYAFAWSRYGFEHGTCYAQAPAYVKMVKALGLDK